MTSTSRPRKGMLLAAAALLGLMAGAAGVYVSGFGASNENARCEAAGTLAEVLKPLTGGEVAALIPADAPQDLAGLAFETVDGAPKRIGDFAGQTLLVNLWATWCVPCREEMPALDRLQAEKGSEAFQVVTVNVDVGDREKPRAFLDEIGVGHLPDYRDPRMGFFEALKQKGLAFGLPTTLLVDRTGCQIAALHGPAEWDSAEAKAVVDAASRR